MYRCILAKWVKRARVLESMGHVEEGRIVGAESPASGRAVRYNATAGRETASELPSGCSRFAPGATSRVRGALGLRGISACAEIRASPRGGCCIDHALFSRGASRG